MSNKNVKKITDFSAKPEPPKKKEKEIPVSEQTSFIDLFEVWLTANWKLAIAGASAIILLVIIAVVAQHIHASNERAVNAEIAAASDIASLENVLTKYRSRSAIVPAAMKLASLYLAEKNYPKAYDTLRIAADAPDADLFLRVRAAIDCAGILEIQGNTDDAVKELEAVASNVSANESQRAEAAYAAARIAFSKRDFKKAELELASVNTARASYDNPGDPYALWATKAAELLAQIKKAGTSAPAATPAPAASVATPAPAAPAAK